MLIFERKNTVGGASALFCLWRQIGGRVSAAEAGGGRGMYRNIGAVLEWGYG